MSVESKVQNGPQITQEDLAKILVHLAGQYNLDAVEIAGVVDKHAKSLNFETKLRKAVKVMVTPICTHVKTRGDNAGQRCTKKATHNGMCSSHNTSNKADLDAEVESLDSSESEVKPVTNDDSEGSSESSLGQPKTKKQKIEKAICEFKLLKGKRVGQPCGKTNCAHLKNK
jgi:hypothetical protein